MFGSRRALLNKVIKGVPLTFSRASVAYNNGVSVPANIPRFQTVDGKTGILIEEGTTNLISGFASLPTNGNMIMASPSGGSFTPSYESISFNNQIQTNSAVLTATYLGSKTYSITHTLVTVIAGQPYTATIFGGSIGGSATLINIDWYDSTNTWISTSYVSISPNTLGKFILTGTAPANATKGQMILSGTLNQGEKLVWNAGQFENKAYSTSWTLGSTTRQPETLTIDPKVLNIDTNGTINLLTADISHPSNISKFSTYGSAGTRALDASNKLYGDYSAKQVATADGSTRLITLPSDGNRLPCVGGIPYSFSLWGKEISNATGTPIYLSVTFYDSNNNYVGAHNGTPVAVSSTYRKIVLSGTIPANAVSYYLSYWNSASLTGDILYWGNAQVEPRSTPTDLILGGTQRNSGQGTIEFELYINDAFKNIVNSKYSYIFHSDDGGTKNIFGIQHSPSAYIRPAFTSGGILKYPTGLADSVLTTGWHKFSIRWDINSLIITMDGDIINQSITTDLVLPFVTYTRFMIGSNTTSNSQINTLIRNVCISKIKRTDIDTQARVRTNTYPIDSKVTGFMGFETDIRGVASA